MSTNEYHWEAPDLDEAKLARLRDITDELTRLFPLPPAFVNEDEIINLTHDQAELVRIAVRRNLLIHLLHQEFHMHEMDDCGDYLTTATDNWVSLYSNLFNDDFQNEVEETKKFLTDYEAYPIGASDGEVRHAMLPDGWDEQD